MKNTVEKCASLAAGKSKALFATAAGIVTAAALVFSMAAAVPAFAEGGRFGAGAADSPCMRACAAAACKGFSAIDACGKNAWCDAAACVGLADADNDGVCDNYGTGIGRAEGAGFGQGLAGGGCGLRAGQGFVDADGDGLCDTCGRNGAGCYRDADGDGVCDGYADGNADGVCDFVGSRACGGYVDADGNGVCDNAANRGSGAGGGYADENGDGVCDNVGQGYGCGRGQGAGNGNGNGYRAGIAA